MATVGIGIDLVEVSRMKALLLKGGDSFRTKIFSASEIAYSEKSINQAERYAARFAAKEAFIKAFGQTNVTLKDISVHKEPSGKPLIVLSPTLKRRLKKCFGSVTIHLALTHTDKTAAATVLIETVN